MSIGNFVLGTGCTWYENGLQITKGYHSVSEAPFSPASDGSFTVSVCLTVTNFNSNTSQHHPILCQAENRYCNAAGDLFAITALNKKINACVAINADGSNTVSVSDGSAFSAGEVTVIDLVVKRDSVSLYVNGYLVDTVECSITPFEPTKLIGLSTFTNNVGYTGSTSYRHYIRFHAINLYNRTLSAGEVETNYNTYMSRYGQ